MVGEEYSEQELINVIGKLQNKVNSMEQQGVSSGSKGYSSSLQNYQNSIVEWQLDLSKEFELIYHQLRGHVIKRDDEGNEFWSEPDDPEQKLLNEKGAQEVERIIRNYLNKNVLLSNFTIEIISERVSQFAHRLRRFIYLNYEEFGLTTLYKQKHFEMLVMNIVDMVEASYFRALNGEERNSLTTVRQVIQQETFDSRPQNIPQIQPSGSKLNPSNWFK